MKLGRRTRLRAAVGWLLFAILGITVAAYAFSWCAFCSFGTRSWGIWIMDGNVHLIYGISAMDKLLRHELKWLGLDSGTLLRSQWAPIKFQRDAATQIHVSLWPLMLVLILLESWLLLRFFRRRSEFACENCGYDLRGTPERCPECGRAVGSAVSG